MCIRDRVEEVRELGPVAARLHHRGGHDALRRSPDQVVDHGPADAEAHHQELPDAQVVHQPELVVGVGVPGAIDLQRASGLAGIRIAQVGADAAEVALVPLHGVEGRGGLPGREGRVEAPAGDEEQGKAGADLPVVDADGASLVERHGDSPPPRVAVALTYGQRDSSPVVAGSSYAERSSMDHVEFDRGPRRNLTTLVIAFGGWIDAGRAATGALRHLARDLGADRLARINPEEFFVFTQERPEVRMRADGGRDIHWPRSEFFAWHPDGRDGLLLFCGPEPHQRWRAYTNALLGVAERCGVRRIVSLGALLAGAPHTRPVRVTARCTDPASRSLLEAWGIYRPPTYEGPTGISSVVLEVGERRGIQ